jgi:chloride channel 7
MVNIIALLHHAKLAVLNWAVAHHSIVSTAIIMLCFCLGLVIPTALAVIYIAPMAAGSGLPEVITMLNGCDIPGLLAAKTVLVKALGICVLIVSGLAVGREAPMIHVGAAVGNAVLHIPWFYNRLVAISVNRRASATFNINSEAIANFTTMGAAAGIAAAFAAPISGVVYILEEMATYWPMWMTMQAFVCTSVATFMMQLLAYGEVGSANNALLGDKMPLAAAFTSTDLPAIIFLGILCGLLSSFVVVTCKSTFTARRKVEFKIMYQEMREAGGATLTAGLRELIGSQEEKAKKKAAILNVFLLTVLAVAIAVFVPLAFSCTEKPANAHRQLQGFTSESHTPHAQRVLSASGGDTMQRVLPTSTTKWRLT